jgi:O-antigen biosynthesis protein WbqP
MKRAFDLILGTIGLLCLGVPMVFVAILVKVTSRGPVIYWSDRIGKNSSIFKMPKFRTMRCDTPPVPTHLLLNAEQFLTPPGKFLRRFSIDELPQLFSIIKGDMSFVGPRPALFNQDDLMALRAEKGIDALLPGLTGWAQINGRDELPIPIKVGFEEYYLAHQSFMFDLKILIMTFTKVARSEGVKC